MSYTKEFQEWALKESGGSFVFESQEVHFWLSAFAKLVREEEAKPADKSGVILNGTTRAFTNVCQKFGLEEK